MASGSSTSRRFATRARPPTIAHTVEAEGDLSQHLRDATSLLVIDNFEQVIPAARDLALLLGTCPNVRVLATSREPLRISHEQEYALDPLPEAPAVELFRHRAAAAAPDVAVEYTLAAEICLQLDRLPLAIELAAARSKVFEPEELLVRLERRLPVLVTRARDVTSASGPFMPPSRGATSSSMKTRRRSFARSPSSVAARR